MRIVILTPTFLEFSGIDRVAEQQALDNAKKGNKVTVFALKASIKPKGYNIVELGMPKSPALQRLYRLFFFLDRGKIRKYAKQLKDYDVAISHMYPMNLIASRAKKLYKVKYVFHNHGIGYPSLFTNMFEKAYMLLFILFNNLSLRNVDEAYSVSKFMQSELKRESGVDSKVVYNKIDRKKFRKGVSSRKVVKKHNLKGKKVLLFVGRLSPHKGVDLLLKAFSIINEKVPNAKLLIVGKPTFRRYYKKLRRMANRNVIFVSGVKDEELPCYYAACDVYVTASLWEGFNLPAAEAQFMGKPVVAFNCCSHPEIVKKGILVRERDVKGFANAVVRLLK
jgi:1,2-diacylglycerol 3-alpha-glucosyltransferase